MDSLYAQTVQTAAKTAPAAGSFLQSPLLLLGSLMGIFYFLILRPQTTERKKRDEMLKAIQRGDRVLTKGGLYGTVTDIKEQVLILKINENNKVEIDRSYIESVQKNT